MSGFQVYSADESENTNKSTVDFDVLNKYCVDTANLQDGETLIGYISNIVDLGSQKLPDNEYNLDAEDKDLTVNELNDKYAEDLDSGKITKFEMSYDYDTKSNIIKKFVPQKDRQCITYSVDFPEIQLDKGQFFGDTSGETKPLRLWFGGEFWNKGLNKMLMGRVIPLKKTKDDNIGWTVHPMSALYKMAVASKVISKGEAFQPEQVDQLLGKSMQFNAQVFFKKIKDGREFYTEKLGFVGALARSQEPITDTTTHLIQFHVKNDETALKELRNTVINQMSTATNWNESEIKKQLIALGRFKEGTPTTSQSIMDAANNSPTEEIEEIW